MKYNIPELEAQLRRVDKVYHDDVPLSLSITKSGRLALNLGGQEVRTYKDPQNLFNDAILISIGYHASVVRQRNMERNPHTTNRDHLMEQVRTGTTTLSPEITKAEQEEVLRDEDEADIRATMEEEADREL